MLPERASEDLGERSRCGSSLGTLLPLKCELPLEGQHRDRSNSSKWVPLNFAHFATLKAEACVNVVVASAPNTICAAIGRNEAQRPCVMCVRMEV